MANVRVILELIDLNGVDGILANEEFQINVRFQDLINNQPVLSGYVDVNFDSNAIRIDGISHADNYNEALPRGTILSSVVDEVGGFLDPVNDNIVIPEDNLIFTLKATALQDLTVTGTIITTDAGEDDLSEIGILGNNQDQRNDTEYGSLIIGNFSGNTAPTISNIDDLSIELGQQINAIAFNINDLETNVTELSITSSSSNTALVPTENIVISGSGENRSVTITPLASQTGTTTITLNVSDGELNAVETFDLIVNSPPNTAPIISNIGHRFIKPGETLNAVAFTIGDRETSATELSITFSSSNTALVPTENIVISGSVENRSVTITPLASQTGTTTITLNVSDGELSSVETFDLTVREIAPNEATISIQDRENSLTFAGATNDTIDFSESESVVKDRLYGGSGNDTFYLGSNDFVFGGAGDDRFFVVKSGGNILVGGEGSDEFWIANQTISDTAVTDGAIPSLPNFIADFVKDEDIIRINGTFNNTINDFSDLSLDVIQGNTNIKENNNTLAIVLGVENLDINDFEFIV